MATSVLSTVYSTAAPTFRGVWMHAPASPSATERHFLYGNIGRSEKIGVDRTLLRFVGRAKPVAEYGENDSLDLALSVTIPYDSGHDAAVQWWRDRIKERRTLLYRDNRGRAVFVSCETVTLKDAEEGTIVTTTATEVDFSEAI